MEIKDKVPTDFHDLFSVSRSNLLISVLTLVVTIFISVPAFGLEWHKAYERGRARPSNQCAYTTQPPHPYQPETPYTKPPRGRDRGPEEGYHLNGFATSNGRHDTVEGKSL